MQDYFGKNADVLKTKKLYLFDMDGTIYRENDLFDGVIELSISVSPAILLIFVPSGPAPWLTLSRPAAASPS